MNSKIAPKAMYNIIVFSAHEACFLAHLACFLGNPDTNIMFMYNKTALLDYKAIHLQICCWLLLEIH